MKGEVEQNARASEQKGGMGSSPTLMGCGGV